MVMMIHTFLIGVDYSTLLSNLLALALILTPFDIFVFLIPERELVFHVGQRFRPLSGGPLPDSNFPAVVIKADVVAFQQRPAYRPPPSQEPLEVIPEGLSVYQLTEAEELKAVNYIESRCQYAQRF